VAFSASIGVTTNDSHPAPWTTRRGAPVPFAVSIAEECPVAGQEPVDRIRQPTRRLLS
jgi:hypothetical protein